VATKPTWIEQELQRRAQGGVPTLDETARELAFQKAAVLTWGQLITEVRADVEEFKRSAGEAEFTETSPLGFRVERPPLALTVTADLANHIIRYDYQSRNAEAEAAPEGGIFSLRISRYGRVHLYSADERLNDEEARRMLIEPVLFPENSSLRDPAA
jgi:hypothetical protein